LWWLIVAIIAHHSLIVEVGAVVMVAVAVA